MHVKSMLLVLCVLLASAAGSQGKLHGLTHSPLSMNHLDLCIDKNTLLANMELVAQYSKNFRVYSIATCQENTKAVLDFARERKMGVMLGVWISKDVALNKAEMKAMRKYTRLYKDVIEAVIVGNEPIFVIKLDVDDLLGYMKSAKTFLTKRKINIPVTTAEVWPLFQFNTTVGQALVDHSDFICMQIQPYWEGFSVRCADDPDAEDDCVDAGTHVELKAQEIEDLYNKEVVICETGWPTFGETCCEGREFSKDGFKAVPSEKGATEFLEDLVAATSKSGRPYYYHEAIDADWKRIWAPCTECTGLTPDFGCSPSRPNPGCEVDYHFGLFTNEKVLKNITIPTAPTAKEQLTKDEIQKAVTSIVETAKRKAETRG
ncbi:hypothetical protein BSKO_11141 [Bryopsis sp. KO-2023]|nr:hypothetical protein BSKO_11141 [Bryopsis sp. KO-2023]